MLYDEIFNFLRVCLLRMSSHGTITHGKIVQNLSGNCTESVNFQDKISGHDITHPTESLHLYYFLLCKLLGPTQEKHTLKWISTSFGLS